MRPKIILTEELVKSAIANTNSIAQAAKHVGISYQTFRRRVSEFGLDSAINPGLKGTSKPWTTRHYQLSEIKKRVRLGEKIERAIYYQECQFSLAGVIKHVRGYDLLVHLGMYSIHSNPNGVVRDHRYPMSKGFKERVDPKIISHPANCEFLSHKKNASKSNRSSVTLEDLLREIVSWDEMVRLTGLEPARLSTPDSQSGLATNYNIDAL